MPDKKIPTPAPTNDTTKSDNNSRIADLTRQINESDRSKVYDGTISNTRPAPDPKDGDKGKK